MANGTTSNIFGAWNSGYQQPSWFGKGGYTGPSTVPSTPTQPGKGPYGAVPTVPAPAASQLGAIQGNVANLGQLYGLTAPLNQMIAQQAAGAIGQNLPGYGQMVGQSSQNILSQLQGQVPQDVANQIAQMAAERGVSTGSIGSPNANTALLVPLGLTSLGLEQGAESQLTGAIQRTPTGQLFNPQQFLVSPQQQQEAAYMASLYGAAPTPGAAQRQGLGLAQQGFRQGLGTQFGGGIPGLGTDALGFPQSPDAGPQYGPGGIYGATSPGAPAAPFNWQQSIAGGPTTTAGTGTFYAGADQPWQTGMQWPGLPYQGQDFFAGGGAIPPAPTATVPPGWQAGMMYPGATQGLPFGLTGSSPITLPTGTTLPSDENSFFSDVPPAAGG